MDKVKFLKNKSFLEISSWWRLPLSSVVVRLRNVEAKAGSRWKLAASGTSTFAIGNQRFHSEKIFNSNRWNCGPIIRAVVSVVEMVAVYLNGCDKEALHTLLVGWSSLYWACQVVMWSLILNMNAVLSAAKFWLDCSDSDLIFEWKIEVWPPCVKK